MTTCHQEKILNREKGTLVWCLHCERTYKVGDFRKGKKRLQMCPYDDCSGDTVMDSWPWADIREKHPEYPEVPEKDKVYPLY